MGAKLACPGKLVVNFMGDTAFGMVGMDVETAVREQIPILTVLLNNSAMGNYHRMIPIASAKYRTNLTSGRYADVARGLAHFAERIGTPLGSCHRSQTRHRRHPQRTAGPARIHRAKSPTWRFAINRGRKCSESQ